jgi:hypothetical protein
MLRGLETETERGLATLIGDLATFVGDLVPLGCLAAFMYKAAGFTTSTPK